MSNLCIAQMTSPELKDKNRTQSKFSGNDTLEQNRVTLYGLTSLNSSNELSTYK